MGIRSKLKQRVKRALGRGEAAVASPPVAPPSPPAAAPKPAPAAAPKPAPAAAPKPDPAPAPKPAPAAAPKPTPAAPPAPAAAPPPPPEPEARSPEPAAAAPPAAAPTTFESDFATDDAPVRNAHYRQAFETTEAACTVRVQDLELDTWLEFPCEPGEFVLDAAERAGFELPFSCRSGGCLVCAGKLLEGDVEMGEQYVLEDEHIENRFRLLCCTTVSTDAVFIGNQEHEVE